MFRFNPRSRCNRSPRCCYRARELVHPAWSRRIKHGGDSHPKMSSSPGSVGLARAHPLTKTQAMEPSRQTWSSYGSPSPLGRWSSGLDLTVSCVTPWLMAPTFIISTPTTRQGGISAYSNELALLTAVVRGRQVRVATTRNGQSRVWFIVVAILGPRRQR